MAIWKCEDGQWWYYARHQRLRGELRVCEICGKAFPCLPIRKALRGRYCSRHCSGLSRALDPMHPIGKRGPSAAAWKGGRTQRQTGQGYMWVWQPDHPKTNGRKCKYVQEHRLVMEKMLGRYLKDDELVHHINGIKDDNRPENLELWIMGHPNGQRLQDLFEDYRKLYGGKRKHCPTCTCYKPRKH